MDALLVTRSARSFAELSLAATMQRRWPSLYEALRDGQIDQQAVESLLVKQVATEQIAGTQRLLLAGDHTTWPRLYAETLADRTVEYQYTPIRANRPITIGYSFSTIAWLPNAEHGWALPMLNERIGFG